MALSFQHFTSTAQLTRKDADVLLKTAKDMERVLQKGGDDRFHNKLLASLFYEPSTRTRLSFETAMQRLGGKIVTADGLQFSSLYKGESLEDTIKVISQYADAIVMRHPEKGSADRAASVSTVPFINAGDGPGQHPTQSLLDLYTIEKERGGIDGVHVAMVGDLKFGRTVHSLTTLLTLYPKVHFTFVSPKQLMMPPHILAELKKKKVPFQETTKLSDALTADVIYMTRVQKERFNDPKEYEKLKLAYVLTAKHLKGSKATVLHPLPRVGEIATDVDALKNAAYFRQVRNGIPMRMAILNEMLKE